MNEYVMFYSRMRDVDLHMVVEFMLIIKEKSAKSNEAKKNVI